MTTWPLPGVLLMASALAFCGWLCLFKTSMIAGWARRTYAKSRLRAPFSSLVLKPWYPTYLRCMGVFAWLFATALVSMIVLSAVRH